MPVAAVGASPRFEAALGKARSAKNAAHCSTLENDVACSAPSESQPVQQAPVVCAICLEEPGTAAMHRFTTCGHSFCRSCLNTYALVAIATRNVPIA